jgi:hypothetical protein
LAFGPGSSQIVFDFLVTPRCVQEAMPT